MPLVLKSAWRPHGVTDLEPNAWGVVRADFSQCVVAGPGSGKTELLAQRASYLLETGICRDPQMILAISFKKDAADNLEARVGRRCPENLSRRFVSRTFDGFTKGMLDRFRNILPDRWRPAAKYEIAFPNKAEIKEFLEYSVGVAPPAWRPELAGIPEQGFETKFLGQYKLPLDNSQSTPTDWLVSQWIDTHFKDAKGPRVTFAIINRLAELLLRVCPQVLTALRLTYPFVFIDEFQDTTFAQFDLLRSAFGGTDAVLTAVGDHRQRIMLWAGARPDAFRVFASSFAAKPIHLVCNYRSSPELVRIQHYIARAIDPDSKPAESRSVETVSGAVAQIWRPANQGAEAIKISSWIADDIENSALTPRDYAILVRQEPGEVEARLAPALSKLGLRLRNESRSIGKTNLQDLLSEELTRLVLALSRLIGRDRDGDAWTMAMRALVDLRERRSSDAGMQRKTEKELSKFIEDERSKLSAAIVTPATARQYAQRQIDFLGKNALRRTYPAYAVADVLEIAVEALLLHFEASASATSSWSDLFAEVGGQAHIPLMTIHKSKGLEYHTVLFLGLDDDQWWSHSPKNPEGTPAFFVAFSRAKRRAFFTCCRDKTRSKVADLHKLLLDAGVPEVQL